MRVFQLLPTLNPGDAVGNDAVAIDALLKRMGLGGGIYAENIAPRYRDGTGIPWKRMPRPAPEDAVLYHHSMGSQLSRVAAGLNCKKAMVYHNVTPPEFFGTDFPNLRYMTRLGQKDTAFLRDTMEYCIADSTFNKQGLLEAGYTCPIGVCPVLIPFEEYQAAPNADLIGRFRDGCTNVLFVGRVTPNKRQEDVIRAFALYQRHFNPRSRLFIAGGDTGTERYTAALRDYVAQLGVQHVHITGAVPFADILAYYRVADVLLCMSEHEGFCVPLLEAMFFDVPVVAFASSAIPETLGGSGMLLKEKDFALAAGCIDRVTRDGALRARILAGQRARLADFAYERVASQMEACLGAWLDGGIA
ncbi:MAG: glycosyltransferase [Clostridia bacterium]|nr:glycosyltransferase [Clostridia bacterium]